MGLHGRAIPTSKGNKISRNPKFISLIITQDIIEG